MYTDTIADMLTRIRNAQSRNKPSVEVPYSKNKEDIIKVLKKYGYVVNYKTFKEKGSVKKGLNIELKYDEHSAPSINKIERVSKSGYRIYQKSKEIQSVLGGRGIFIVSTPRGVMSSVEAKKLNLGGEIICKVY